MTTARIILAIVLLLFAAWVAVMNWICVVVSIRNRRRGIDRHHSMVPLMTVLATIGAKGVFPLSNFGWVWIFPALDPSNWSLLWLPFYLILRFLRGRTTDGDGGHETTRPEPK